MATEVQLVKKVHAFVERIVLDAGTAMRGGLTYIGDRLGIFSALAQSGPVTAAELAQRTDLDSVTCASGWVDGDRRVSRARQRL